MDGSGVVKSPLVSCGGSEWPKKGGKVGLWWLFAAVRLEQG